MPLLVKEPGFLAVLRHFDDKVILTEKIRETSPSRRIVIDNENPGPSWRIYGHQGRNSAWKARGLSKNSVLRSQRLENATMYDLGI